MFPDMDELDLEKLSVQRNAVVLTELHARARNGVRLIKGMSEYVAMVAHLLRVDPVFESGALRRD